MSKQSAAKLSQGYDPKPVAPVCMNCKEYRSERIKLEQAQWYTLSKEYYEEKNRRCQLGGFAVKKTATCYKYQPR